MGNPRYSKPRSDCNKHIIRRWHYTRKNGSWKPKKKFDDDLSANEWISKYKMRGYVSYRCPECGGWHIGKNKDE